MARTRETGYAFFADAVAPELCDALTREMQGLVGQRREHHHRSIDRPGIPAASDCCYAVSELVEAQEADFPELIGWLPNQVGYLHYFGAHDRVIPHRDSALERLLGLTLTLFGSAHVRIHVPEGDPPDEKRLRQVDEFLVQPGTAMFLRSGGFGDGTRVIHDVIQRVVPRGILNLRMYPTVLSPQERQARDRHRPA